MGWEAHDLLGEAKSMTKSTYQTHYNYEVDLEHEQG